MIPFLDLKKVTAMHAEEIERAVKEVTRRGWYLLGEEVAAFEKSFAEYIGTGHCVACGNGLDALRLMLRAYMEMGRLEEGDEIIVPANTYVATILAITDNRLTPVLVEPDAATLQIDGRLIEERITPRTRAVMMVHLYGRCACTEQILALCGRYGLLLLEDNAQAHGCVYGGVGKGRRTGSLGHVAAHSFYPGKNLGALGDGGAVTTDDGMLAETIRALANYGSQRKYVFKYRGYNSRLDEIQAAVLRVKLRYLDADNDRRREIARYYMDNINNECVRPAYDGAGPDNVFHIFPVLCRERDRLQQWLKDCGVQTLIHYPIPPHHQECYAEWCGLSLPLTEMIAQEELSLPMSPCLTQEEAAGVVRAVNGFRI